MTDSQRPDGAASGTLSRRDLLKGIGLGAVGVGAASLLDACAPAPTAPPSASSAGPSPIASPSASSTAGRITIGFVTPLTGQAAGFAAGDAFIVDRVRQADAYARGFAVGGKKYDVQIVVKDSQSDPSHASQMVADLILQDRADLIVTTSGPDTTIPVAAVCEAQGVPCLSTVVPLETWFYGRQLDPAKPVPFKYTTMFFFGLQELVGCFVPMWARVTRSKKVAQMYPDDADGDAFRTRFTPLIVKAGYEPLDGGAYPNGSTDFASMIATFKAGKGDIYASAPLAADFNAFWRQASTQGYRPKIATVAKVLQLPTDAEALGDLVSNIATACWWGPFMPFKSSLTNETGRALADAYESASGRQWLQTLGSTYALFEVAHAALTSVSDPRDRNAVAAALGKVRYTGMCGPLDFTKGPIPGIGIVRPVGVQWRRGTTHPWELVVVDNSLNKDVPVSRDLQPTNL